MGDTSRVPIVSASDPRKWIPAIVGGVILGQALWSLLQLLMRDWIVPGVLNLMGQGPTQNQNAFMPQPLVVAFIEACAAGILLVLLMAWSGRGTRTVVVRTQPSVAEVTPIAPAPRPVAVPSPASAPALTNTETRPVTPVTPAPVAPTQPAAEAVPVVATAVATPKRAQPAPAPPPPAKSKKPKTVYYNIVGEAIESDDD